MQNLKISAYNKLVALLKRKANGFKAKKSKVWTGEDIQKFLAEELDNRFLTTKVNRKNHCII